VEQVDKRSRLVPQPIVLLWVVAVYVYVGLRANIQGHAQEIASGSRRPGLPRR
jgi:hypothetical protein